MPPQRTHKKHTRLPKRRPTRHQQGFFPNRTKVVTDFYNSSQNQDRSSMSPQLRILIHSLGLGSTSGPISPKLPRDPVVVCIATEHSRQNLYEFGISTFDTRDLHFAPVITTYNYQTPLYATSPRSFLFGRSESISLKSLASLIERVLRTGSPLRGARNSRDVLVIGHSIDYDFRLLIQNKVLNKSQLEDLFVLDTYEMSKDILEESLSMKRLLEVLHIPFINLHNGGNDSNVTLKALLMLAVYSTVSSPELTCEQLRIRSTLQTMSCQTLESIDARAQ